MLKSKTMGDARIWQILLVCFFISQCCRPSVAEGNQCSKPADIYFVLDASSSIWGPDFKKQLAFVSTVIGELQLDPTVVRCGLITYGDFVQLEFGLDTYAGRKKDTNAAVSSIRQLRGGTRTDKALERMRQLMMAEAREGVPRIAIVMTDGLSDYPKLTKHEAQLTHKSGITTFAIGIGRQVDERELQVLASHEENLFTVDTFDALAAVKSLLSVKACEVKFVAPPVTFEVQYIEGCQYESADIVFVLDSSSSIWAADFSRLLSFVEDLVKLRSIFSEGIRFGVVTYGNTPKEQIQLDQYSTTADVLRAISQIVQQRGGSNTAAALRYLRQQVFGGPRRREDVQKIAVVITDGPSDSLGATAHQAKLVHEEGIRVFAIGVGKNADARELKTIATPQETEEHVFSVDGYDALGPITSQLASKMCKEVKDVAALEKEEDTFWKGSKSSTESTTTTPEPTITTTTTTTPEPTTTTTTTTTTTPTTTTTTPTTTTTTTPPPSGCGQVFPADIVFALPSTANSHQANEALEFIRNVADRMEVSSNSVRIGLVPHSCLSVPGFTLDQGSDKNQVLRMFDTSQKTNMAETSSVVKYLRSVSFRQESGARAEARKIGVLIVDRPLSNFVQAVDESILAKRDNIELIVIGVGDAVSVEELTMLASTRRTHHSVMTVDSYSQLRKLSRRLVSIADHLCLAN